MSKFKSVMKFVFVLGIVVVVGYFFSWFLGVGLGVGIGVVGRAIPYLLDIVDSDGNKEKRETTDTSVKREDDDETTEPSSQQKNKVASSPQAPTTEMPNLGPDRNTPLKTSGLLLSNKKILNNVEEEIGDHVLFYEDGEIEISADDLDLYSRLLLYVIAKRVAFEYGYVDRPEVSVEELYHNYRYNIGEIILFLLAAKHHFSSSYNFRGIDFTKIYSFEIAVSLKHLPAAVEWVFDENSSSTRDIILDLNYALTEIKEANHDRQEIHTLQQTSEIDQKYEGIKWNLFNACSDVCSYPEMMGDNSQWDTFTRYLGYILTSLDDPDSSRRKVTDHGLPRLQSALESTIEQAKNDGSEMDESSL